MPSSNDPQSAKTGRTSAIRVFLGALGLVGLLAFGSLYWLTWSTPTWVENFAAGFIEDQVRERLDSSIDGLVERIEAPQDDGALARAARALQEQNTERIEAAKELLKNRAHEQMAGALARIRDLDCECRNQWATWFEQGFQFEIRSLQLANDKLIEFIQIKYAQVATELKRDLRIFAASNVFVFALLLLCVGWRSNAAVHLLLPAVLLTAASLICGWCYVFEQNWLLTIVYSDYLGWTYAVYLGLVFALLLDIIANRARVVTEMLNWLLNAVGSATSVVPC